MRCRLSVDLRGCSGTLHTPHLSLAADDDRRHTRRYRVYGGDFLNDVANSARAPIVDEDGLAWRDHDTLHVRKRKERADVDAQAAAGHCRADVLRHLRLRVKHVAL